MKEERESDLVESWIVSLGAEIERVEPRGVRQQTTYDEWLDEESDRRDGRRGRLAEASPLVPAPLWIVLGLGSGC